MTAIPATPQQDLPLGDRFYTVDKAADITGLKPMTLWGYLATKKLMRTKIGGTTRIRASELRKLIVDDPPRSERSAKRMQKARAARVEQVESDKRKKAARKAGA